MQEAAVLDETRMWAAEYRTAIANDPERRAADDCDGPISFDATEYPATAYTDEEQSWLDGIEPEPPVKWGSEAWEAQEIADAFEQRVLDGFTAWQDYVRWDVVVGRRGQVVYSAPDGTRQRYGAGVQGIDVLEPDGSGYNAYGPVITKIVAAAAVVRDAVNTLLGRTPAEVLEGVAESFEAVIPNLAYRGLKTLVVGQSKAGKSFTTWAKCAEAVRAGSRVLYLTEEPRATVSDKLRTFNLTDADDMFLVVFRSDPLVLGKKWSDVVREVERAVAGRNVDLLVVDTVRPWFGLDGDGSNTADVIGPAFDELLAVCDSGTALVALHQAPWDKKRARGSTEFHAAVDLVFAVTGEGAEPRIVSYVGGRVEDIPATQTIRWAGGHVEDLGNVKRKDTAANLGDVLTVLEKDTTREMTAEEIADEAEMHVRTVRRTLEKLEQSGKVVRIEGLLTADGKAPDRWKRAGEFWELYVAVTTPEE